MKIGIICPYNMYKGGGVQECVLALLKELNNRGHITKIISPTPPGIKNPKMDGVIFVGTAAQVKAFHTTSQVSVNVRTDLLKSILIMKSLISCIFTNLGYQILVAKF